MENIAKWEGGDEKHVILSPSKGEYLDCTQYMFVTSVQFVT